MITLSNHWFLDTVHINIEESVKKLHFPKMNACGYDVKLHEVGHLLHFPYYLSATTVGKGNVFTSMSHEFCAQWGCAW